VGAAFGDAMTRTAVVGSGIAGLSAAWNLARRPGHSVSLFEAADYFGGHAHTVDVCLPDRSGRHVTHGVDTGFLVFNHRTYPQLVKLFAQLGVETAAAEMSFSVQATSGLEWSGTSLDSVFSQRRNLARPGFWRMLADVLRFNRLATQMATAGASGDGNGSAVTEKDSAQTVGDFLIRHRFSAAFRRDYFLPMIGCIWSCPTEQMLAFPMATLVRFCHNHGLLQVAHRPQWYTVAGGSRRYVERLVEDLPDTRLCTPVRHVLRDPNGVRVVTDGGAEPFDAVVFACHSDQALALLGHQATAQERAVLGAIRYHANRALLHTDAGMLPLRSRAWAAWNYEQGRAAPTPKPPADRSSSGLPSELKSESASVCLHYLINRLQPLPFAQPVIVSMNPVREPRPQQVLASFDYAHPVFDRAAIDAQTHVPSLQGRQRSWFCGAWTGYGFHEDGLASGMAVAEAVADQMAPAFRPWPATAAPQFA
jgi:predicted NAD/FAD-binding protein